MAFCKFEMLNEIKTVRALLSLFQLYPWTIPTIIVLGVLSSLAEGLGIGLIMPFLQELNNVSGSISDCPSPFHHKMRQQCDCVTGRPRGEQGSFQDLLKLDGLFTRLYNLQYHSIVSERVE